MSIRITGMSSGMDTDSMVKELVNAYEKQGEKYTKNRTKNEWKQEAWTDLNKKVKNFFSKYASNMRFSQNYNKKITTVSDSTKASVISADNAVIGSQTLEVKELASSGYLTGKNLGSDVTGSMTLKDLGYSGKSAKIIINQGQAVDGEYAGTKSFDIDETTTIDEFAGFLSSAGYNANFDLSTGRLFVSSKQSGAANDFSFAAEEGSDAYNALSSLGLVGEGATKIPGSDAKIILNGAEFTSSTNSFSVNGLTITAKAKTAEGEILSVSTDSDTEAIYNNIKKFISEYSSLINEIDKMYNAADASKYEPLSSEEKDELTDDEIEKWEKKIKDSLLRYDSDLDTIGSAMRTAMLSAIEIGGKKYSLSDFGIGTMGYFDAADNEKNALHIDGDPDDENTSGNADKLKSAIATNPDLVAQFFSQLSGKLYDEMNKISSRSDNYTSYGSFYSDKKIKTEYDELDKQVTKWEDYVAKMEEKYYKQFTAMETSLSKIQSQSDYLSQLFA